MSVLLNPLFLFFPTVCSAELGLNTEVTKLLNECEQPGLAQSLLLPEDLALRHLPALSVAHRRLDFTRRNPSLSSLQEVNAQALKHEFQLRQVVSCLLLSLKLWLFYS